MTPAGRPRRPATRGRAGAARGRGPGRTERPPARGRARREGLGGDQVEGRQAVLELLTAGRRPVRRVLLARGLDPSPVLDEIESRAARRGVPVELVPRVRLDALARTEAPQGVVALARPVEDVSLEDLCRTGTGDPFLVVAAGVTDPANLGAVLRAAECAGATGVVLPRHRAAHLTPTVTKVASGAVEHLAFALVGGVPSALEQLRAAGVLSVGLAGEARRSLYDLDLSSGPVALVVGSEGKGLAPLVRKRCDEVVRIPQHGALPSLNVGVASAVACFEVARQRAAARR